MWLSIHRHLFKTKFPDNAILIFLFHPVPILKYWFFDPLNWFHYPCILKCKALEQHHLLEIECQPQYMIFNLLVATLKIKWKEMGEIWYEFDIYRTLQFGLVTFQVPNRHMWLVATILNRAALESSGPPTSPCIAGPTGVPSSRRKGRHPLLLNCTAHSLTCPHLLLYCQAPHESATARTQDGRFHKEKEQKWCLLTNKKHYHRETSQTRCPNAFFCLQHQKYNTCHQRSKRESNF